jgi:uncharacterized protein
VAVTGARVFQGQRTWRVSPAAFAAAAALIADAERPHRPGLVIGIERGGHDLAVALAERLQAPAVMITARHNRSDRIALPASGLVTVDPVPLLSHGTARQVLIADDICGSGATLRAVTGLAVSLLGAARARTAVLCRNTGAGLAPSTWAWDVADWVCFPWESQPATPTEDLPLPTTVRHP